MPSQIPHTAFMGICNFCLWPFMPASNPDQWVPHVCLKIANIVQATKHIRFTNSCCLLQMHLAKRWKNRSQVYTPQANGWCYRHNCHLQRAPHEMDAKPALQKSRAKSQYHGTISSINSHVQPTTYQTHLTNWGCYHKEASTCNFLAVPSVGLKFLQCSNIIQLPI